MMLQYYKNIHEHRAVGAATAATAMALPDLRALAGIYYVQMSTLYHFGDCATTIA